VLIPYFFIISSNSFSQENQVFMLAPIEQIIDSEKRYNSPLGNLSREDLNIVSEEVLIGSLRGHVPEKIVKGNILGDKENLEKRKEMIGNVGPEPLEFAFERAIGKNDSVYSNFVELISDVKRKVGRVVVKRGSTNIAFATGFMVSEDLLLTNWHVFKTEESVAQSEVQFFYELDTRGNPGLPVSFALDSNTFFHSFKELDYCLVAVNKIDVTNTVQLNSIGYIFLDPTLGKLGNEGEERVNIIHHPDGDYKQLSIRENLFTKILPTSIWYESDTAQGSSGGPVFNDQWQIVALHHMGVAERDADGDFVDKNKKKIPIIGKNIDISKIHWIANEGIRISVILKDVFDKFPNSPFVSKLKNQPLSTRALTTQSPDYHEQKNTEMQTESNSVHISFPSSLMDSTGMINININSREFRLNEKNNKNIKVQAGSFDEDFTEVRKIDTENGMDFSACKGYQSNFLGVQVPLPQPKPSINKFIAKLKNSDAVVLKYHHYSLIFHSLRMMPLISAINVDGDPNKRLDDTERIDNWLRDNRIDYDIQLNDKYYRGSGFDRGHMSRREDANWGKTAEDAKLFADMTCMYTNACPQIRTLNQSNRGGLWGKLEKVVLENGAILERGKTAKISVFNGPIFKESDGVFRGIQIPMEFYKVIVWLNDDHKLKATAFKLSQNDLVDDIDFEAIDIDQNAEFQEFQCSIKSLEKETKIDFSFIEGFDTFNNANSEESRVLSSEEELKEIILSNSK
jgi:endonuclease G